MLPHGQPLLPDISLHNQITDEGEAQSADDTDGPEDRVDDPHSFTSFRKWVLHLAAVKPARRAQIYELYHISNQKSIIIKPSTIEYLNIIV